MDEIMFDYWDKFGEFPPKLKLVSYDNEFYTKLMKDAIKRNRPISAMELDMAIDEQQYDVVQPDQREIQEYKVNRTKNGE